MWRPTWITNCAAEKPLCCCCGSEGVLWRELQLCDWYASKQINCDIIWRTGGHPAYGLFQFHRLFLHKCFGLRWTLTTWLWRCCSSFLGVLLTVDFYKPQPHITCTESVLWATIGWWISVALKFVCWKCQACHCIIFMSCLWWVYCFSVTLLCV